MAADAFSIEPAVGSIVGGRDEQQDATRVERFDAGDGTPGLLLLVADGMGGHAGGREASRIAVDTYGSIFLAGGALALRDRLLTALEAANHAVGAAARDTPALRDMGCTIVAATLVGDCLHWVSVGDSLLLAIHDGQIARLNADHSLAPQIDRAAREGRLSRAEAASHPDRNVLLAALNGARLQLVDEGMRRLPEHTLVLLATDGILSLSDEQILGAVAGSGTIAATVAGVLSAVEADMPADQDNTTLIAVRSGRLPRTVAPGRRGRRILGALSLLTSVGGILWVVLLLRGNRPHDILPGRLREGPTAAAPARPTLGATPGARTADRHRPTSPDRVPAPGPQPPRAGKKPARSASEVPHFSLSAPGSRTSAATSNQSR